MSGTDVGAGLMIVLLGLAVTVVAVVVVALCLRARPHWSVWVLSAVALAVVVAALWAAVAPAVTVDGVTCTGSAADRLVGASTPDDPFPEECLEEARVQVVGWLFLVAVVLLVWAVAMARALGARRPGTREDAAAAA
ncbi:hypothetical protein ACQFYA_20470 [Promicromonospora sp. Marseille-Q5078]